ncbi:unnamed protein product [Paramecium primaurelia]|uniref:Uncharacterized protein n=1 Tax=Paramecium primaurelia TaxID=5886 RepID=A0A8S1QYC7_PARPR|nr:unnamed protein product [Paramecium primaurelia]
MFPIQKEKKELQESLNQLNYFEDIIQLSEVQMNQQDNLNYYLIMLNIIKLQTYSKIQNKQFKIQWKIILLNCHHYYKQKNEFVNNYIYKLKQKTPSLSRICFNHKKEIIMIDMDTENKKIEDRLVFVDCIFENP